MTDKPIASSEARGLEEETDKSIASSEARDKEERESGPPIASSDARG